MGGDAKRFALEAALVMLAFSVEADAIRAHPYLGSAPRCSACALLLGNSHSTREQIFLRTDLSSPWEATHREQCSASIRRPRLHGRAPLLHGDGRGDVFAVGSSMGEVVSKAAVVER